MRNFKWLAGAVALAMVASPAAAEIVDAGASGFTIRVTTHPTAGPGAVYAALIQPRQWWNGAHSFSGSAANFTFDAKAGGCWCETLPGGGSAEHMRVVFADPGKILRLRGGLGPMQAMAILGAMTWTLKPAGNETDLTLTYTAGGYGKDGFAELAKSVDGVLREQVNRLTLYVDTGMPEPQP